MPRIRLGPPCSDDIKVAEIYGYMTVDTQGKTLKGKKNLHRMGNHSLMRRWIFTILQMVITMDVESTAMNFEGSL